MLASDIRTRYPTLVAKMRSKGLRIDRSAARSKMEGCSHVASSLVLAQLAGDGFGLLRHNITPFGTVTGRDVIRGISLTSIKKHLWGNILAPPKGHSYVLYDYCQQEPFIAACFANDQLLIQAYSQGDLYRYLGGEAELNALSREQIKLLVLPYLYGQTPTSFCRGTNTPEANARAYFKALDRNFIGINRYLNNRSQQAFREGKICSLDWQMLVTHHTKPLTVRNWPIQAAGADILRRACIGLDKAGIDLRLTIHDAFLVQVPTDRRTSLHEEIVHVLQLASQVVLNGNSLRVRQEQLWE